MAVTEPGDTRSEPDDVGFEAFYRREYPGIVRVAFALTGRRAVAEELAQDSFLACYRHWDRISGYDDPIAWVRRVATNRCVSSGRRHVTELRLLVRLRRERSPDPSLSDSSDHLWDAVRELPRRQAQVVALAFVEDLDVGTIAATLGIGEESVRTHLRRGRAAIAARMKEEPEDD